MKTKFSMANTTQKGQQTIHYIINNIQIDKFMSCFNTDTIQNLCETGCVNYGKKWSCPPYAPKINSVIETNDYSHVIIIAGYIFLDDMYYIKNAYQKVKAANMILKSKCEGYARTLEKMTKGYALLSGSCNLCKPCSKKNDLPCKKPEAKRYSMESTGINVGLVSSQFCGHELLWYKKGGNLLYTTVVTAVLHKNKNPFDYMSVFGK